jgi:hypothetical protein
MSACDLPHSIDNSTDIQISGQPEEFLIHVNH